MNLHFVKEINKPGATSIERAFALYRSDPNFFRAKALAYISSSDHFYGKWTKELRGGSMVKAASLCTAVCKKYGYIWDGKDSIVKDRRTRDLSGTSDRSRRYANRNSRSSRHSSSNSSRHRNSHHSSSSVAPSSRRRNRNRARGTYSQVLQQIQARQDKTSLIHVDCDLTNDTTSSDDNASNYVNNGDNGNDDDDDIDILASELLNSRGSASRSSSVRGGRRNRSNKEKKKIKTKKKINVIEEAEEEMEVVIVNVKVQDIM